MNDTTHSHYRALPVSPVPGRALNRILNKRLGLNQRLVHDVLRRLKRLTMPGAQRASLALPPHPPPQGWGMDAELGYRRFDATQLPGWQSVATICLELFEQYRGRETTAGNPRKTFLHTLADADTLLGYPELLAFMLHRPLLDAARDYMGTIPQLAGAALWWTPPNDTATRSQLWHLDEEDHRQFKVLIPLSEVTADSGPFTFISAADSAHAVARYNRGRLFGNTRRLGRLTDATLAACDVDPERAAIVITGPAGAGVMVDSSRCLHFGSRGNRVDRVVLMFHFLPWDTPSASTFRWTRRDRRLTAPVLDPVQQAVLGVKASER